MEGNLPAIYQSPEKIRVSRGVLHNRSRFFGAGTSKDDVESFCSEDSLSPTKSPKKSPKKTPSPIKLTKNHPVRSFARHRSRLSLSFQKSQDPSPDSHHSPQKADSPKKVPESPTHGTYYFDTFYAIVQSVRTNQSTKHLFTDEEIKILDDFKKDQREFYLYVRLLNRKDSWKMMSSIQYPEIADDLQPLFQKLEEKGFITCDLSKEPLVVLLNLLNVEGLKKLCKLFKVKMSKGTRDVLIEKLHTVSRTQSFFSAVNPVQQQVSKELGRCFRLAEEPRRLFRRCVLLFAMFHSNDELDKLPQTQGLLLLEVRRGNMIFPISAMEVSQHRIFTERHQFLRYEKARELRQQIFSEEMTTVKVETVTEEALKEFQALLEEEGERDACDLALPFRRWRAGSVYARILEHGAMVLRTNKNIDLAKSSLAALQGQDIYLPHHQGRWSHLLATLLHLNLKDPTSAAEELCRGLRIADLTPVDRTKLNSRAQLILKRKNIKLPEALHQLLASLVGSPPFDPPSVEIKARSSNMSRPGMKRLYVREEGDGGKVFSSVEEEAIDIYRQRGFPSGRHDEGRLIRSLCLLYLWDVIYDPDVPQAFCSQYQDKPLDWGFRQFYLSREKRITEVLELIETLDVETVAEQLKDTLQIHRGTVSVVDWDALEGLNLMAFLECVTIRLFAAICRRLMEVYRASRAGFPDLTLWNVDKKKCLFVEVKGPGDTLSTEQVLWLQYLIENGGEAVVANVLVTGSKEAERE